MASMIGGFKDKKIEVRSKVEPSTVQYIGPYRQGLDVNAQIAYVPIQETSIDSGSTTSIINLTGHLAKIGDVVYFKTAPLVGEVVFIINTTTNSFEIGQTLSAAPAGGDIIAIYRPGFVRVDDDGNVSVSITGAIPLPTGAATAANQVLEIAELTSIESSVASLNTKTSVVDTDNVTVIAMPTVTVTPQSLTSVAPTTVSVGTSSTSVLSSATRKRIIVTNLSQNVISLGFNNTSILNSGVTLTGYGSSFVLDGPITSTVTAIASAAASNLAVQVFT